MTAERTGSAEDLALVIIKLGRLLERRINRDSADRGATASQLLVLDLVARTPGTSRADVARAVHITPQAVGGLLAQLEGGGMVSRARASSGQPLRLSVTDAGLDALERALAELDPISAGLLAALRPEHRGFVDGALRHVLRRLEAGCRASDPMREAADPRRTSADAAPASQEEDQVLDGRSGPE